MGILIFIIGIVLFVLLVVIHELGHAIAARRNGVEVEEFGIGFPPRAWGKKLKSGMLLSLNWLPLGGFVKLKGEHDSATGKGTYGNASLWAKTKILLAGVAMNWIGAVLIFTMLALIGMPKLQLPNSDFEQFRIASDVQEYNAGVYAGNVGSASPAERAGLKQGDKLISVGDKKVESAQQLTELTKANAGKNVQIVVERDKKQQTLTAQLNETSEQGKGHLGVGPAEQTVLRSTWSAPIVGVGLTVQFTQLTFEGLGKAIANLATGVASKFSGDEQAKQAGDTALNEAKNSVAGPVGIFNILWQSSDIGFTPVLLLIGIISLTLAVMNILPIPALDGGRLFVTLIFRALKKPLTEEREEKIQAAGFVTLMALILLITVVDVGRLFGK